MFLEPKLKENPGFLLTIPHTLPYGAGMTSAMEQQVEPARINKPCC